MTEVMPKKLSSFLKKDTQTLFAVKKYTQK